MYKCSLYYNKKLDEYKSNAKSTWKLLNDLINKKKIKCKLPSTFKSNEEEMCNPSHIADRFCEYFTTGMRIPLLGGYRSSKRLADLWREYSLSSVV